MLFILHFTLKSGDNGVETGIVFVKQKKQQSRKQTIHYIKIK